MRNLAKALSLLRFYNLLYLGSISPKSFLYIYIWEGISIIWNINKSHFHWVIEKSNSNTFTKSKENQIRTQRYLVILSNNIKSIYIYIYSVLKLKQGCRQGTPRSNWTREKSTKILVESLNGLVRLSSVLYLGGQIDV